MMSAHRDLKPAEIEKRHEFAYAHADRPELVLTLWACSETVGSSTITTINKAERNMAFRPEHREFNRERPGLE